MPATPAGGLLLSHKLQLDGTAHLGCKRCTCKAKMPAETYQCIMYVPGGRGIGKQSSSCQPVAGVTAALVFHRPGAHLNLCMTAQDIAHNRCMFRSHAATPQGRISAPHRIVAVKADSAQDKPEALAAAPAVPVYPTDLTVCLRCRVMFSSCRVCPSLKSTPHCSNCKIPGMDNKSI